MEDEKQNTDNRGQKKNDGRGMMDDRRKG